MEEHVRLLSVNGNVTGGAGFDGVRGRSDVLGVPILLARLAGVGLDGGILAQVGVGDEQLVGFGCQQSFFATQSERRIGDRT